MRIAILTYGSRGDVQPMLALGAGLLRAGHSAQLAAPAAFADLAAAHGLGFTGLPGDIARLSRDFVELAGTSPLGQLRVLSGHAMRVAEGVIAGMRSAAAGADLIVHSFAATGAGALLSAELGVPEVSAQFFPFFAPYTSFPSVALPGRDLGPALNRLTHDLATLIFNLTGLAMYATVRLRSPEAALAGLPWPAPGRRSPLLLAYSPLLVGPTPRAAPLASTTGFWSLPAPEGYRPPGELAAFLAAGPPPVFVGFGSMAPDAGLRLAAACLEALGRAGRRALIQGGWAGLGAGALPGWALAIGDVPHSWLLPRVAAVIHHGGAGTTAAALRSGAPSLAAPFSADQPFWGWRAHRLGVGPPPIPARALTAGALAAALPALLDPGTQRRAAAVGAALRAEDGVGAALRAIEAIAGTPR